MPEEDELDPLSKMRSKVKLAKDAQVEERNQLDPLRKAYRALRSCSYVDFAFEVSPWQDHVDEKSWCESVDWKRLGQEWYKQRIRLVAKELGRALGSAEFDFNLLAQEAKLDDHAPRQEVVECMIDFLGELIAGRMASWKSARVAKSLGALLSDDSGRWRFYFHAFGALAGTLWRLVECSPEELIALREGRNAESDARQQEPRGVRVAALVAVKGIPHGETMADVQDCLATWGLLKTHLPMVEEDEWRRAKRTLGGPIYRVEGKNPRYRVSEVLDAIENDREGDPSRSSRASLREMAAKSPFRRSLIQIDWAGRTPGR
jgi:hypothetical protein